MQDGLALRPARLSAGRSASPSSVAGPVALPLEECPVDEPLSPARIRPPPLTGWQISALGSMLLVFVLAGLGVIDMFVDAVRFIVGVL